MARGPIEPMPLLRGTLREVAVRELTERTYRHQEGHLIWTGRYEKVGRYRYPFWTFNGGGYNAARWAWHLLCRSIDRPNVQLVKDCDNERCVAPEHHHVKAKRERVIDLTEPVPACEPEKCWTGHYDKPAKPVLRLREGRSTITLLPERTATKKRKGKRGGAGRVKPRTTAEILALVDSTPGWDYERAKNGHWSVILPDGRRIQIASTASDYRTARNDYARLARHGLGREDEQAAG